MHLIRFLPTTLLGGIAAALVLIPSASSANGDPLQVGVTTNAATATTSFNTTAAPGFAVTSTAAGGYAIGGLTTDTMNSTIGVYGESVSSGEGSAGLRGRLINSSPNPGSGATTPAGVFGSSTSTTGAGPGIYGLHTAATGTAAGVYGETASTDDNAVGTKGVVTSTSPGSFSAGVRGINNSTTGSGVGVWGSHAGSGWGVYGTTGSAGIGVNGGGFNASYGVYGWTNAAFADAAGVFGHISSSAANAAGVRGENSGNCCGMAVAGFHSGQGIGVYGEAQNGFAVSGFSPNNWSGYFQGSVNVVGTLTKTAGAFRIDNPIDPAHSYLQHSFVESPDMKNIYDGVITTNGKGSATVKLPAWFQALNRDFRYQLTVIAKPGQFVQAMVVKEMAQNRFTLETSKPNVKVSWQVTGIRKDAYANAHRIQTVVPKGSADGRYVHPELYGKPLAKSIVVLPGMTESTKPNSTSRRP